MSYLHDGHRQKRGTTAMFLMLDKRILDAFQWMDDPLWMGGGALDAPIEIPRGSCLYSPHGGNWVCIPRDGERSAAELALLAAFAVYAKQVDFLDHAKEVVCHSAVTQ